MKRTYFLWGEDSADMKQKSSSGKPNEIENT
jgi:hypothetical protein